MPGPQPVTQTIQTIQITQNTHTSTKTLPPIRDSLQKKKDDNKPTSVCDSILKAIYRFFTWLCCCGRSSSQDATDVSGSSAGPKTEEEHFKRLNNDPAYLEAMCKKLERMADSGKTIGFYNWKTNPLTAFMGNFYYSPITETWTDGRKITFYNVEAYFHACKYWDNLNIVLEFTRCRTGEDAFQTSKKYAHLFNGARAQAWHAGEKRDVMWQGLQLKFMQNPALERLLLATKNAHLSEVNPGPQKGGGQDRYWSTGPMGDGEDQLGKMMMEMRDYLSAGHV